MTNTLLTITTQFLFCLFVEKYLKESYLMMFLHSLKIITYLLLNNLVLGQMILVSVSFYQLFIVFIQILILIHQILILIHISKAFDKVWHEVLLYKLESLGITGNLLKLFQSFLIDRQQRVALNGQHSKWAPVLAGFLQGSILGPLLFLIYINDLPENLESSAKLFADDTSLFSTVYNLSESANLLNDDLKKILEWAFKWKMLFNPDITKQAKEVIFSRRNSKIDHPTVFFNEVFIAYTPCQNHLGMHLDEKLNFQTHIKKKTVKASKGIGIINKLAKVLPRESLITIYKSFVTPHIDYGDIIYDQPNHDSSCNMIKRVQYNAALAVTGAIKGTSQLKIYKELGLESPKFRWFRRLFFFI